jgi:hypothetical protein
MALVLVLAKGMLALAEGSADLSVEKVVEQAKVAWDSGAVASAIELFNQGIHDHSEGPELLKLRGDILSMVRTQQSPLLENHARTKVGRHRQT